MMQTRIDCRVGFECCAHDDDERRQKEHHRVGGRSSESSADSSSKHMESPIKKMLLNELIKEHEKELLLGGNLVENNTNNNARKKKKIYEDETEEETDDAIARSNSSTDACFAHALFHHNTFSSEPIPIPVADLQLRYDTQRVVKRCFSSTKCFSFRGKKSSFACKKLTFFPMWAIRYFRVAQKERALFGLENKSKFTFLGKSSR